MKHRTAELEGALLDAAVAMARCTEGPTERHHFSTYRVYNDACRAHPDGAAYCPSTDWAQGGPIIERERIELQRHACSGGWWAGVRQSPLVNKAGGSIGVGQTALVAAMRAYVASKLGEEVDLP